jgi:hypothetical protein
MKKYVVQARGYTYFPDWQIGQVILTNTIYLNVSPKEIEENISYYFPDLFMGITDFKIVEVTVTTISHDEFCSDNYEERRISKVVRDWQHPELEDDDLEESEIEEVS